MNTKIFDTARWGKMLTQWSAVVKTLDDVVNVLEEMSEAAATLTKPVLLVAEYAVRLKVANKFLSDYSLEDIYKVGSERDGAIVFTIRLITLF